MAHRTDDFQTIRSEGGLLPPDLLRRVLDPKSKLAGTQPEDYGLAPGERLNEAITHSWNRLRKHWAEFRGAAAGLPAGEAGTGLTNDRWTLPLLRELGFGLLPTSAGPEVAGRSYAISRFFGPVPVHLVGCGLSLDRRAAGQRGAAATNPHGLLQEFLNRSPGHLWGIAANGLRFRILRDSQALSRQSFLEFDVEAMFHGEAYSDFVLLWLVAHATRFAPREGDRPETSWLEQWTREAQEQGARALEGLRGGVEKALVIFGEGFTSHPRNAALREALRSGAIPLANFHGQLLRVVYRLIFLFVAEDRTLDGQALLHPPDSSQQAQTARERYATYYSAARLRELAGTIKGSRHGDLWRQFQLTVRGLSGEDGSAVVREQLALPTLGSLLWSPTSTSALNDAELTNYDFLEALRHLAFARQGKMLRPVDYKNLGAEELGGVYESLLALTPQISADGARFTFAEFSGNERKTSGSYYTPDSLVQSLLDSALNPVVEEAIRGKPAAEAEKAILALKVCDPAVGSGHFLVGAAHRLARHLARARALTQGESEPSPPQYQHALRDVIGRCLYGVDLNPMAAELCRVSLWLEALEPGKPLTFLDHHIRVGNSLLGTTPDLVAAGVPDEAFTVVGDDDKRASGQLKKRNRAERKSAGPLFRDEEAEMQLKLAEAAAALDELPDDQLAQVQAKEQAFLRHEQTDAYRRKKHLADAWCAAFVAPKAFRESGELIGITQQHLNALAEGRQLAGDLDRTIDSLAVEYRFFHFHLAFPEVFAPRRTTGVDRAQKLRHGFDCVLGNPPFLGGLKISEFYGHRVRHLLNNCFDGVTGRADLSALMIRRAFQILSGGGRLGMVATNTIGQGETREAGLARILRAGGRIAAASRYVKWPGDANVEVTLLTVSPALGDGLASLDGETVAMISSRLDTLPESQPRQLAANRRQCFQGSIVLGKGFILSSSEAAEVIEREPRSAECLFPYLTGEDINTSPAHEPSRWVIQFDERKEDEAMSYEGLWQIVTERVLPERRDKDVKQYPRMVLEWWKHWNNRQDLYAAVRPLARTLARSRVSEYHMLAWVRTDIVYSDACVVFAFDDDCHLGVLQSVLHEVWLRREASTMRTDVRYTPTDCFSTFPFPEGNRETLRDETAKQAAVLYQRRQDALLERKIGFTGLYNLVNDNSCSDSDVRVVRDSIRALDQSVLALYGWEDLEAMRGFIDDERDRKRFAIADQVRVEIIRRLTEMNLGSAEDQEASEDHAG